jgi:hypothetical protein
MTILNSSRHGTPFKGKVTSGIQEETPNSRLVGPKISVIRPSGYMQIDQVHKIPQ